MRSVTRKEQALPRRRAQHTLRREHHTLRADALHTPRRAPHQGPRHMPPGRTSLFKPCQHLCGFITVRLCTQWYVQGVLVACSGSLWFLKGPWSTPVAYRTPSACTCGTINRHIEAFGGRATSKLPLACTTSNPQTHEIQDFLSNSGLSKEFCDPCLGHDTIWRPGQEMKVYVDNNKHVDK